jgi:DNA-binding MarR family transcriptional regulator
MQAQALSVTVAWLRLERAHAAYARELRARFGISPLQLSVLALLAERGRMPLAALRLALDMHAATLGQAVDGLRRKGLCLVRSDPDDRRARLVFLTEAGRAVLAAAPKAGPVRLRDTRVAPERLELLAESLADAMAMFGLDAFSPDKPGAMGS